MNILDLIFENLYQLIGLIILKVFDAGSGIMSTLDPVYEWKKSDPRYLIRNKHPRSATLLVRKKIDEHFCLYRTLML